MAAQPISRLTRPHPVRACLSSLRGLEQTAEFASCCWQWLWPDPVLCASKVEVQDPPFHPRNVEDRQGGAQILERAEAQSHLLSSLGQKMGTFKPNCSSGMLWI